MTKDRLAALVGAYSDDDSDSRATADMDEATIDILASAKDSAMQELFAEVEDIRQTIERIQQNVERVKLRHSDILTTPHADERTRSELEDLTADIKRSANRARAKLKLVERGIDLEDQPRSEQAANARIRRTQHAALSRKFVEVMSEYNRTQTEHRQHIKRRIQRQLEITGRATSDDQLEEMLERGDAAVFTQGIVMGTRLARQTRADIEARHADIVRLENSIRELHDMFMDMAVLVESQGELVDRVEYHVAQTTDYVCEGKMGLGEAHKYQRRSRKKLVYILLCLLLVATIVLVVLLRIVG